MKKTIISAFLCIFLFITGCEKSQNKKIDFSEYPFTGISWTRDGGNDIETIKFNIDGSFSYYCSCGNPVNDSDLCESYTYNEETKEIKLDCFEITEEMVTTIKVVNFAESILELDFDGEIRKFERSK